MRRRNLLLGGAGLTLGTSLGCREREASAPGFSAQFVGQSPERGHLLRSAELLSAPIDETRRVAVAIVGGGASGFSAAWRLRKAGLPASDLLLFDLEPRIGGTAAGDALPRAPHPMGAHYLPTPPRECFELHELLADVGVLVGREFDGTPEYASTAICSAPLERHFLDGQWYPGLYPEAGQTQDEADQFERFWELLQRWDRRSDGAGRLLFRLPARRSSPKLAALDSMSMADWLKDQGFDSWRLDWFVDYACRDDYGCSAAQTSAWAGLHHFLGRGLAQNREGQLLVWPGGNGDLVALIRNWINAEESVLTDHLVYAIDPDAGSLRVRDLAGVGCKQIEAD
ncbi:MAG: NAD(P)-binding protein, partial [Myxococcales bacterium]|nr:NAD(P)-binding protein [Myxococcales bacterium]